MAFTAGSEYDVVVAGGGTAGAIAAIQAGRAGARTLLVEKNGILGGTMTAGGVDFPGLFHAWGRQVIAGIGWNLVVRAVEEAGRTLPDFSNFRRPHPNLHVRIDAPIIAALMDDAATASGVDLLLHTMPAGLTWTEGQTHPWLLNLCMKEGLSSVQAKTLVDCTGDANLIQQAGFNVERNERVQPGSIRLRLSGYDVDQLDSALLAQEYERAVADGRLKPSDFGAKRDKVRKFLRNNDSNHVVDIDAHTSASRTEAELEGRRVFMRIFRFLRGLPGLEGLRIDSVACECGIRESITITGKAKVTMEDYWSGRLWSDALCYSFYPIDVHDAEGHGIDIRPLPEGAVPTIPRGAMLPAGSRNLIVAGRCISCDKEAQSALRVEASCMAMGQAAGAMAALSAELAADPEELPISDIRAILREHGAIVPE